jgi:integrase
LRCADRAGLDAETLQRLTPHSTRATYAASNLAAGASLRDVQYALGHEDPRTTEHYDRAAVPLDRHPSTRLAELIESPELG